MSDYQEWIRRKLTQGTPIAMCDAWTREMVTAFPELTRERGHVLTVHGEHPHWWCVAPDGSIVDPTAAQFISGIISYEAHEGPEPVGKCLGCGGYVYAPRGSACSDACEREIYAYYNGILSSGRP